jgi:hypothetical protein
MIIITEKRLPPATSESENVPRISGSAIPRVATIMDGIKFEQGTIKTESRSRCSGTGDFRESMGVPISAE